MIKQQVKKRYLAKFTGRIWNTREEAIRDNTNYKNDVHYRYSIKSRTYKSPLVNYTIPYIPEKRITLSNAGLATGAVLSTNLLDSIAVNAQRAGLPIKTALGLVTKESTLNNNTHDVKSIAKISKGERNLLQSLREIGEEPEIRQERGDQDVVESSLINYNPDDNPYFSTTEYLRQKSLSQEEFNKRLEESETYDDMRARKRQAQPSKSYLQAGFEKYAADPYSYNSGQSNYVELVNKRAEEVWGSPEIQQWYRNYKRSLENAGK